MTNDLIEREKLTNQMNRPPLFLLHGIKSSGKWQKLIPSYLEPLFRCIPLTYREYHFLGSLKIVFWPWLIIVGLVLLFSNSLMTDYLVCIRTLVLITFFAVIYSELTWALSHNSKTGYKSKSIARKVFYLSNTVGYVGCQVAFFTVCYFSDYSKDIDRLKASIPCLLMVLLFEGREIFNSSTSLNYNKKNGYYFIGKDLFFDFAWIGVICIGSATLNNKDGIFYCVFVQILLWVFAWAVEPRLRLKRVTRKIANQIQESRKVTDQNPSIIAHSFGTKVLMRVIETSPGVSIDKVILVGCVLPADNEWEKILDNSHVIIKDIRNEFGRKDVVVRWLAWAAGCIPGTGLGRAGYCGFVGDRSIIHDIKGPLMVCHQCNGNSKKAVHNVALAEYGHSDWFLTIEHAKKLWIPYLFGVDPAHYHIFQDLCKTGANAVHVRDWGTYNVVELKLRETYWSFEPNDQTGKLLEEMIAIDLRLACPQKASTPQKAKALARRIEAVVVLYLILEVVQACIESEHESDKNWDKIQWSLNPRKAVTRAVNDRVTLMKEQNPL